MAATELFLDTCVLLNYVQAWLERSYYSEQLFEQHDSSKLISTTVESEFDERCDSREFIYSDIVDYILYDDGRLEEYPVDDRDNPEYITNHDRSFVQRVVDELSESNKEELLRQLREYHMQVEDRRQGIYEELDSVLEASSDAMLKRYLQGAVRNRMDRQVLVDASDWSGNGGSGVFITKDKGDILKNTEQINEAIDLSRSPEAVLEILTVKAACNQ
ncbi:hypothetical protein C438_05217 [Haloferax denitrificans ATCC 35960]|uniref:DUF4935 domain-containing protein n=1 Tax=Haloferax denitrificans ATCC 35960 TaxID=662478 RepID=M0JD72_9EURY|nr:hypothetical protein C438_05217 [Haloferax denitrificans ATCC 35960]